MSTFWNKLTSRPKLRQQIPQQLILHLPQCEGWTLTSHFFVKKEDESKLIPTKKWESGGGGAKNTRVGDPISFCGWFTSICEFNEKLLNSSCFLLY